MNKISSSKKNSQFNFAKMMDAQNKKKMAHYKESPVSSPSGNGVIVNLAIRLRILRQMTNLSIKDYCKQYELDETEYNSYENGEAIIPNSQIRQIISKMFFNNEIFCRSEWVEGYEKIAPVYINHKTINLNQVKSEELSTHGKLLHLAYGFKSLHEDNVISVVGDSLMGKLYKKGTLVVGRKYDLNNESALKSIVNTMCIIETADNKEFIREITFNNGSFFCNTLDPIRQSVYDLKEVIHVAKIEFAINKDLLEEEEEF